MSVKRTVGRKPKQGIVWQLRRDRLWFALIAICLAIVCSIIIPARTWSVFGSLPTHVATPQKLVALTFDDGPTDAETAKLLATLRSEDVKATFYLIGVEMERHPRAADAIAAAGHEIGNHSYSHNSLMFMSWSSLSHEIEKTDSLIRGHGYEGPITIRPPYGHKLFELPTYAAMHHRELVMWDFVLGNQPNVTIEKILNDARQVRPGSIIIMHAMYAHNKTTLDSVAPLVKQLKSQGYQFVTVSELLGAN
jgi:peptidoglycan/xylan/chitin deacetylase (PgdA/CDA1 family)